MKSKKGVSLFLSPDKVIAKRMESLRFRRESNNLIIKVVIIALFVVMAFTSVFGISPQQGEGMYPRVRDGDIMIYFRMAEKIESGDIITLRVKDKRYTGRIVAIGGDTINLNEDGKLIVNGAIQYEEIFYDTFAEGSIVTYPYTIPKDSYFILGDMRTGSTDSRDIGAVSKDQIDGKVITIIRRRGL